MKSTIDKVEAAIQAVSNGFATQYVYSGGKTIRISNHGANPARTDYNVVSIVIGNDGQSFRTDRGRIRTNWEQSNEWYMTPDGEFVEQFDTIKAFLEWFEID